MSILAQDRAAPARRAVGSRLFLLINETVYRVLPLGADPGTGARAFRLNKPDGTLYDVAQTRYGPTCDCPDFVFRREGLDPSGCKHVKALVAEGLIADGPAPDLNPTPPARRARVDRAGVAP